MAVCNIDSCSILRMKLGKKQLQSSRQLTRKVVTDSSHLLASCPEILGASDQHQQLCSYAHVTQKVCLFGSHSGKQVASQHTRSKAARSKHAQKVSLKVPVKDFASNSKEVRVKFLHSNNVAEPRLPREYSSTLARSVLADSREKVDPPCYSFPPLLTTTLFTFVGSARIFFLISICFGL